jgi:hypothetical protein
MIIHRQITREHRIDYLLYANTYIAALFVAIFFIDFSAYSIYGQRYMDVSFNGWWCKVKGYLMYINGCTFFYTFALQAIYRVCRILYRTKVRLQSFRLYTILSVGLWILVSCELLPSLLIGDIEYITNHYHCQFSPKNLRASLTVYPLGFILPFSITVYCYTWAMCSVRRQTAALMTINQRVCLQRNIIILKRLMTLLCIVTIVAAPHILLPIVYIIIGHLPEWVISVGSLLTGFPILAVSITLLFVSPHLKRLWTRVNDVNAERALPFIRRHRR